MRQIMIKDVIVGSKIRIVDYHQPNEAWLVGGPGIHPEFVDHVLVGWKQGEPRIAQSWVRDLLVNDSKISSDFVYFYWVLSGVVVEVIQAPSDGAFCKGCTNWFAYAVPNRPSGNFVCWSCRQGFIRDEW